MVKIFIYENNKIDFCSIDVDKSYLFIKTFQNDMLTLFPTSCEFIVEKEEYKALILSESKLNKCIITVNSMKHLKKHIENDYGRMIVVIDSEESKQKIIENLKNELYSNIEIFEVKNNLSILIQRIF